ncbi:unnamed protein product [Nesidiocoris tenuis]|uniref:Lipid-binding serum glycoprotein N-terminal domain-containing protein n=1 Tax=Nesidiocoris tenuis TaxID=355587 RepID=A0A6H5FX80_9HEMI|nr:unnamed protein product [Nesidiocoris tenuis]
MKFYLCAAAALSLFLPPAEPAFFGFLADIQKLRDETAAITQSLEKAAPPSKLANIASSTVSKTTGFTAGVLNSANSAIVNFGDASANWIKNMTNLGVNKGADAVIGEFQKYASTRKQFDNMTLPDINSKFSGITFTATGGYFAKFSSLYKNRNINVSIVDDGINIRIPLSLRTVDVGYNEFRAKFGFSMSGNFRVMINTNEINVILRLQTVNPCALNVERVEVTSLEGIKIEFQNSCKQCSSILSSMSSGLANFMRNMLKKQMQNGIDDALSKFVDNDSLLPWISD